VEDSFIVAANVADNAGYGKWDSDAPDAGALSEGSGL
jgi:hypothetical protein